MNLSLERDGIGDPVERHQRGSNAPPGVTLT
jgi:hypothetical protein